MAEERSLGQLYLAFGEAPVADRPRLLARIAGMLLRDRAFAPLEGM